MIAVLDTTMTLQSVLDGGTTGVDFHVVYLDTNAEGAQTAQAMQRAQSNGGSDVTICTAPVENQRRGIIKVWMSNTSAASRTVTIKTDNGTERVICSVPIAAGETAFITEDGIGRIA